MISHPPMTQPPDLEIKIDNCTINQVKEVKFLGITIDNTLRWKSHINEIKNKICKVSGIIFRIRDYIVKDSVRQIYLSLGYPHLIYCCAIWGRGEPVKHTLITSL